MLSYIRVVFIHHIPKSKVMKLLFRYLLLFFCLGYGLAVDADPLIKKGPVAAKNTKKKNGKKPPLFRGADYNVASKTRSPLNYTRAYSKSGKFLYLTTYNIYDRSGTATRNIVAVHDKRRKTIEVTIKDLEHSGFPVLNVERTGYTSPFMGRFGATGKVGVLANGKPGAAGPGQLTVKFVSKRFDYIKVVHVAGPHEDSRKNLQVIILDEG
jgi:hypothetical protein